MSSLVSELLAELPDIFLEHSDASKEIGIVAITMWFHAISRATQNNPRFKSIPPVLLSTLAMLLGLGLLQKGAGEEVTNKILKYFEPSVDFLGNWMSLWLVPPLVLLPNAVRKVPNADASVWGKLAVVHFVCWCLSVSGSAMLMHALEGGLSADAPASTSPATSVTSSTASSSTSTSPASSEGEEQAHASSSSSSPLIIDGNSQLNLSSPPPPITNGLRQTAAAEEVVDDVEEDDVEEPEATRSNQAAAAAADEAAAMALKKREKHLKIIRFWGVVTTAAYASNYAGLCSAKPGLASTAITAYATGQAMPASVRKVLHPLLFTAFVSALSAIVVERIRASARGEEPLEWTESLYSFTTGSNGEGRERGGGGLAPGDYLSLMLGPSCTALAFRIFANTKRISSKLPAVFGVSVATAVGSLFLSPTIGNAVGLPPDLNLVLSHRCVTSALAVPSAVAAGASPELTVAAVLITGLYGASGEWLMESLDASSDSCQGTAVGANSHSIGTASLVAAAPNAAVFASVSMLITGIVHALVCTIPYSRVLLRSCAGHSSSI